DPFRSKSCWTLLSEVDFEGFKLFKDFTVDSTDWPEIVNFKRRQFLEDDIENGGGLSLTAIRSKMIQLLLTQWHRTKDNPRVEREREVWEKTQDEVLKEVLSFYRQVCLHDDIPQTDLLIKELMTLIPELHWRFALDFMLPPMKKGAQKYDNETQI